MLLKSFFLFGLLPTKGIGSLYVVEFSIVGLVTKGHLYHVSAINTFSSDLLIFFLLIYYLSYVWFPENLGENARERKYKGKVEGKKK